jgi:protein-arginine kinase activator protein McsA
MCSSTGSLLSSLRRVRAEEFCQAMARLATIMGMGRKDKGREICINCGQTFHKKLTSKELRCTKCRKAEKKAA